MTKRYQFESKQKMEATMAVLSKLGVVGAWTNIGERSCRYFDNKARVWRDFIAYDAERFCIPA
ncbi:MAG: hypothetical protein AAAB13_20705 [Pseudomonas sp.]